MGMQENQTQKTDNKPSSVVIHCKKLLKLSGQKRNDEWYRNNEKIYTGYMGKAGYENSKNHINLLKLVIQTRVVLLMDAMIGTAVVPKSGSMIDLQRIDDMKDIADILNDIVKNVWAENSWETLKGKIAIMAEKFRIAYVRIGWDQEKMNNLGQIVLSIIHPQNAYPDPDADTIENCKFFGIKTRKSLLQLAKEYPDKIDIMRQETAAEEQYKQDGPNQGNPVTVSTAEKTTPVHTGNTGTEGLKGPAGKDVIIWEMYIRDDSTYVSESDQEQQEMQKLSLQYPNGRLVCFTESGTLLRDGPTDYPFGIPVSAFETEEGETLLSQGGMVDDLKEMQLSLNRAYKKRRSLIAEYISAIINNPTSGLNKNDYINRNIIDVEPGTDRAYYPDVITNNTMSHIKLMSDYINEIKQDIREKARVNESMTSGRREKGVNSGVMLDSLNESPMAGIRDLQRAYIHFRKDLTKKTIVVAQTNYNLERMIVLSGGGYAVLPLAEPGGKSGPVRIMDNMGKVIKEIQFDAWLSEYTAEVVAGSEVPRTQAQHGNLTRELVENGVFGDPRSLKNRKRTLQALEFPNWRAITEEMEREEQEQPVPSLIPEFMEKNRLSELDEMPLAKRKVLEYYGIIEPVQEQEGIENV